MLGKVRASNLRTKVIALNTEILLWKTDLKLSRMLRMGNKAPLDSLARSCYLALITTRSGRFAPAAARDPAYASDAFIHELIRMAGSSLRRFGGGQVAVT